PEDVLLRDPGRDCVRTHPVTPLAAQPHGLFLARHPRGRAGGARCRHRYLPLQNVRGDDLGGSHFVRRRVLRVLLQQPVSRAGVQYFSLDRNDPRSDHRRHRHIVRADPRCFRAHRACRIRHFGAGRVRCRFAGRETDFLWHLFAARRRGAAGRHLAVAGAPARRRGAQPMTALLSLDRVSKRFRGLLAVDAVSFDVPEGVIFAVIGPNGAGKTTLFYMIAGAMTLDDGAIAFAGEPIGGLTPDAVCRRGVARTFQLVRPFPALSVEDNVIIGALLRHHGVGAARERALAVLRRLDLFDKRHQIAATLTLPDRKRLEVARALATEPKLLLLDEVMAGLRPTETDRMVATLREINRESGLTILLIEHVMRAVMALAARVLVLDHGVAIAAGTPEEVVRDPAVVR